MIIIESKVDVISPTKKAVWLLSVSLSSDKMKSKALWVRFKSCSPGSSQGSRSWQERSYWEIRKSPQIPRYVCEETNNQEEEPCEAAEETDKNHSLTIP